MSMGLALFGVGVGAGLILIGAGLGIGKLAAAALEGTARQPEAGGMLRTSMLIAAAFIEGVAFFGLVICLLMINGTKEVARIEQEAARAAAVTAPAVPAPATPGAPGEKSAKPGE